MKLFLSAALFLFFYICIFETLCLKQYSEFENQRPIIGILAQETTKVGESYIAASYVKYLESAGARVVPIFIDQPQSYYEMIVNSTNGILFPGGSVDISNSSYAKAGRIIFDLVIKINEKDYFPLWGTCLGFELLSFFAADNQDYMDYCVVNDEALPLDGYKEYNSSRLFKNLPSDVSDIVLTLPVTANYHDWCLTPETYFKHEIDKFFSILTTNTYKNYTFISTIEAIKFPIYGTIWHPEKNQFEFVYREHHYNIPHSPNAIKVGQAFAQFFVNEARKNNHTFSSQAMEQNMLIYNYNPVYTGRNGSSFEQKYFFK